MLHVTYQQKLEQILYILKLTLMLLFLKQKSITPLQKGEIWSDHSLHDVFANVGYVWACISIIDHSRPVKVIYCLDPIMHQA